METYEEMDQKIVELLRQSIKPTALYAAQRIEELEDTLEGIITQRNVLNHDKREQAKHIKELESTLEGKDTTYAKQRIEELNDMISKTITQRDQLLSDNHEQGHKIIRLEKRRTTHLDHIEELQNLNDSNAKDFDNALDRIATLESDIASYLTAINVSGTLIDTLTNLAELQDLTTEKIEGERDSAIKDAESYRKEFHYYKNLSDVSDLNAKDDEKLYSDRIVFLETKSVSAHLKLLKTTRDLIQARDWAIHYRKLINEVLFYLKDKKERPSTLTYNFLELYLNELSDD